ncbi:hypothetical protein [Metallibacterium scheffleri]|uniref:Nmad3 family putative nucleotide modification protein n=1 Tax=Metallibacterium scheffleri TaxID=993689 RepID=UPI0014454F39|nr:hypothetical protein [Metallibacterium scheffleri]
MNALLVRVGADLSEGGGRWNGPMRSDTGEFVYVAIPEGKPVHAGYEKPYQAITPLLSSWNVVLPAHLADRHMHLDPDFAQLTYGDQGQRAVQLRQNLQRDDWVVFYAALRDVLAEGRLIYALIGLLCVDQLIDARTLPLDRRDVNAHSRRILAGNADDLVVTGQADRSGRLQRCLPIGEWRDGAYRVRRDLLGVWGGLSVKDGYLQRSARLPRFLDPPRFLSWISKQDPELLRTNN